MAGSLALFFLFFPFSERHFEHLETSWQKHKEETGRNRKQMKKRENSTPGIGTFVPSPTVCTCRHTLTGWILISTLSSTCRLKDSADSKRAFPCILNDALLKNQTEKKNRKIIQIYSTLDIECVRVCVCIKLRFILHMEVFSFYLQGHTGKPFFIIYFFLFSCLRLLGRQFTVSIGLTALSIVGHLKLMGDLTVHIKHYTVT